MEWLLLPCSTKTDLAMICPQRPSTTSRHRVRYWQGRPHVYPHLQTAPSFRVRLPTPSPKAVTDPPREPAGSKQFVQMMRNFLWDSRQSCGIPVGSDTTSPNCSREIERPDPQPPFDIRLRRYREVENITSGSVLPAGGLDVDPDSAAADIQTSKRSYL